VSLIVIRCPGDNRDRHNTVRYDVRELISIGKIL